MCVPQALVICVLVPVVNGHVAGDRLSPDALAAVEIGCNYNMMQRIIVSRNLRCCRCKRMEMENVGMDILGKVSKRGDNSKIRLSFQEPLSINQICVPCPKLHS